MNPASFNRHDWTVADVDRVVAMAARGNTARQIANAMGRKEDDVVRFGERNRIFIRRQLRIEQ